MGALRRLLRGQNEIDFRRWWRIGLAVSTVLIVASVGSLALRGLNLSVEFTGGVSAEVAADGVEVDEARAALEEVGLAEARVQTITPPDGVDRLRVQTGDDSEEAQEAIRTTLAELGETDLREVSFESVSASWGADISRQALRALVFFLVAITLYLTVRLEARMAAGAMVATAHDLLVAVGVYSLFQFEVTPGTVIAFLMILGYSIYDTVVVYDKVKEYEPLAGVDEKLTYTDVVSVALNKVLLRSLNTSITSLLPVASILLIGAMVMGAATLGQFGIAIAIGLAIGTYSSIMVASPVVAMLKEREPRYRQVRERIDRRGASRSPIVAGAVPPADPTPAVGQQPPRGRSEGGEAPRGARDRARDGERDRGRGRERRREDERDGGGGISRAATTPATTSIPPRPRKKGRKG